MQACNGRAADERQHTYGYITVWTPLLNEIAADEAQPQRPRMESSAAMFIPMISTASTHATLPLRASAATGA